MWKKIVITGGALSLNGMLKQPSNFQVGFNWKL